MQKRSLSRITVIIRLLRGLSGQVGVNTQGFFFVKKNTFMTLLLMYLGRSWYITYIEHVITWILHRENIVQLARDYFYNKYMPNILVLRGGY